MEVSAVHWVMEVMWSYSDHMVTGSEAIAGGYAYKATQHGWAMIQARRKARREARKVAEQQITEM